VHRAVEGELAAEVLVREQLQKEEKWVVHGALAFRTEFESRQDF
jgi:hypothetical protein